MNRSKRSEMIAEWASWEWLIRSDLETLEHRIQTIYEKMSIAGIKREDRESFVLGKISDLIREVTGSHDPDIASQ